MLIPVSDLVASAKAQCNCLDSTTARDYAQKHDNVVIIDVRELKEVAESKLEDSVHIPRGLLEMKIADICPDSSALILLHCGGGSRASLSACTLQIMGYANVHVIDAKYDDIKSAFG